MRVRKKKNTARRLEAVKNYLIPDIGETAGKHGGVSLYVEIGCGKGGFITSLAQKNPHKSFIAIEKISDIIVMAAEKAAAAEIPNLKFAAADAKNFGSFFSANEASKIFINFCDPWPGNRHEKRRLTSPGFLGKYKNALETGGELAFKTDDRDLFVYSKKQIEKFFEITKISEDLRGELSVDDREKDEYYTTEYEEKFSSRGQKIYFILAVKE